MYSDKMVFTSTRDTGSLGLKKTYMDWSVFFIKLYVSDVGNELV
jgi:hypothetical protein